MRDGLEISAIAGWGHRSRQPRLISSSSTILVLCNVREFSTTDIIFVSQRNSLPSQAFCATALPVDLPDITRALCHHRYICKYLCVSAKCSSTSFYWNKLPLTVQALPYGPVRSRRPRQAFMYCFIGKQKQTAPLSSRAPVSTYRLHWDHRRCLIWFKEKLMYSKTTMSDSNCVLCWTDRHTIPVVTWFSFQAMESKSHSATVLAQRCLMQVL